MAAPTRATAHRSPIERPIEFLLLLCAAIGAVTTVGMILVLAFETLEFFGQVSPVEFFTGSRWSPTVKPVSFGVIPLITATLLIAAIALLIALPLGLLGAVFLAEYASLRVRNTIKPVLELIAGIPTIVLGFFAIYVVTPQWIKPLLPTTETFNALAAGIVVGILVTPLIASLSEDAMRVVPRGLREGAFAVGATRWEVVRKVVIPAALSGIASSVILAMSRAMGETMAVVLAAGAVPNLTLDPRRSVETMTAFIVQISTGDTPQGSIEFKSLFAVGATLFVMTLVLNLVSNRVVARYRTVYQ